MAKKKKNTAATFDSNDAMASLRSIATSVLKNEAVFSGEDTDVGEPQGFLKTPDPELDAILDKQGRGMPMGRIIELYGPSQTGKSSLAYALIAECQRQGGIGILILAEGEYSTMNAHAYGVDESKLIILDTNVVEDVFETINEYLDQNPDIPLVFVIDSVAGLSTKAESESKTFDRSRNAQARALLLSEAFRRIGVKIPRTRHTLVLVNQVNEGEITPQGFKSKGKPVGGVRIGFYASVRLRMEMIEKIKKQRAGRKFVSGLVIRVTTDKNRLNSPFQTLDMIIDFEKGLRSKASKSDDEEFGDD